MIVIFGREGCAPCKMVKMLLERKKVPFEYKNAVGAEYERLSAKFGFTVPLVVKDEQGMVGYDPMRLLSLIK